MRIDKSPRHTPRLSDHLAFRLAGRVFPALIAGGFGFAAWYAIQAILHAIHTGGGSILHPPHAVWRPLGTLVISLATMAIFAWDAAKEHSWDSDDEDLD